MPLSENFTMPKFEGYSVLDDDTYQVVISDVTDVQGSNYKTAEPETQLKFEFTVVDGPQKGEKISRWVSTKYAAAREGRKESNLYAIVTKAMKIVVPADELHLSQLIGKQLIVVVSKYTNDDGLERNRIESFLSVKSDIPSGQPDKDGTPEPTDDEKLNLNDLPF